MNFLNFIIILSLAILGLSLFLYKLIHYPLVNSICEIDKCPYCFGINLCDEFKLNNFELRKSSIEDLFLNYLSVKNVFYAIYKNSSVVLKKLGHNFELNRLDTLICTNYNLSNNCDLKQLVDKQDYFKKIINFLTSTNTNEGIGNFKTCSITASEKFINLVIYNYNTSSLNSAYVILLKNIWTMLQLNVEPLILQILKSEDKWPVPRYLGACGRVIVESHCGRNLNAFADARWNVRANLAMQLLHAAKNFTEKHPDFRFYLTDVSPDNIAVNSELRVTFVDLENIIIHEKANQNSNVHYSASIDAEGGFAFSQSEICESSLSDHNYYAVCTLLLSKDAPWPMMEGGLLHSPPDRVLKTLPNLFELVEICAHPAEQMNRFEAAEKVIEILENISSKLFNIS